MVAVLVLDRQRGGALSSKSFPAVTNLPPKPPSRRSSRSNFLGNHDHRGKAVARGGNGKLIGHGCRGGRDQPLPAAGTDKAST